MSKRPLKATDRRRNAPKSNSIKQSSSGYSTPLAEIFSDRRKSTNGKGKRAK